MIDKQGHYGIKATRNDDVDQLITHIEHLSDGDVIKALATPGDYTIEAMAVYESEAKRRGIRPETVRPIALQEAQRKKDKVATTWSFKGIGERLYGMRSFRSDGSYQTTKWFVFLYVPIYPIASLRIRYDEKGESSVVDVLPINWHQVIDTYCFVALSWAGIALGFRQIETRSIPYGDLLSVGLPFLPFAFLYLLRYRARRNMK